ncbi:hypothetical protein [Bradyrhizobium elkanii]|nr:hypothetical protein [Bradyrhizobium elkanii]MCP1909744.1 hypothetical protein [Bradyrhizobium elkanii]
MNTTIPSWTKAVRALRPRAAAFLYLYGIVLKKKGCGFPQDAIKEACCKR